MLTTHASSDGRHRVLVVRRGYQGQNTYIGRRFAGEEASVLANPRSLRDGWDRGETLVHYDRELRAALARDGEIARWNGRVLRAEERDAMRAEMNRLFRVLHAQGTLALRCFCAPLACHGDVIARLLLERLEERQGSRAAAPPLDDPDAVLSGLLAAAGSLP